MGPRASFNILCKHSMELHHHAAFNALMTSRSNRPPTLPLAEAHSIIQALNLRGECLGAVHSRLSRPLGLQGANSRQLHGLLGILLAPLLLMLVLLEQDLDKELSNKSNFERWSLVVRMANALGLTTRGMHSYSTVTFLLDWDAHLAQSCCGY